MRMWIVAMLALGACTGADDTAGGDDTGVTDTDTDTDSGSDTDTDSDTGGTVTQPGDTDDQVDNTWSGDDNGWGVPTSDPDTTFVGNLADGEEPPSLEWAQYSTAPCFPATENVNFRGHHVVYHGADWTGFQDGDDLYVRVVPDDDVDVSLYVIAGQFADSDTPWTYGENAPAECETSYDDSSDDNPGQPETICLNGYQRSARDVILGVAGATISQDVGYTQGSYRVEMWEQPSTNCNLGR